MALGTDISKITLTGFTIVSEEANLIQALSRRLQTPRGGLFYDLNYGLDLRRYLKESMTPETETELSILLSNELLKDSRVLDATIELIQQGPLPQRVLTITATISVQEGDFDLIIDVSEVSVEVLRAS